MPLTPEQLERFKGQLTEEKKRLQELLGSFAKKDKTREGDYDTVFPEMGDNPDESADEVEEFGNLLSQERILEDRLAAVDKALAKIAGNGYGTCESCGNAIAPERLEAYPDAEFCMDCSKSKAE